MNTRKNCLMKSAIGLCTVLTFLAGCNEGGRISQTTQASIDTAIQTAESDPLDRYSASDYTGKTFRVLAASDWRNTLNIFQYPTEAHAGDIVDDALLKRDRMLCEHFGITIEYTDVDDLEIYAALQKGVMANDFPIDMILGSVNLVFAPAVSSELLYNLAELPMLDLSAPWWDKHTKQDFMINGKIFGAGGSITTRTVVAPFAMFFNNTVLTQNSLPSPYSYVKDGTWTIDRLYTMISGLAKDIDNNGKWDSDDAYGLAVETGGEYAFFTAAEGRVTHNIGGVPEYCYQSERNIALIQKLGDLLSNPNVMPHKNYQTYDANKMFREDRTLFLCAAICDMTLLRDMDSDFGIVPYPKYDESQENYYSGANYWIGTIAMIPVTVENPDFAGTLTDAMAAVSHTVSMPAEYELSLQVKQTRDAESAEMLQLICENVTWDWGEFYGLGGVAADILDAITNKRDITSKLASHEKQANAAMEKFLTLYQ
ncbi:MAG: extracellular solute-binding protein [Clostridia bacterium]|nr:extracellular solute-binding protein [Clostridia bacterium]